MARISAGRDVVRSASDRSHGPAVIGVHNVV